MFILGALPSLALTLVAPPPAAGHEWGHRVFGMIAITSEETARLNMVANRGSGAPSAEQPGNCSGSLGFVDESGLPYIEQPVSVEAEKGTFLDLNGGSIASGPTTGGRVPVRAVADVQCQNNLWPMFTVEVFESASGRVAALMGGVPDPGWSHRAVLGLVGITGGETIRLNAVAIPVGPSAAGSCAGSVWFLGQDGDPLSTEQEIVIQADEGAYVDLVGGSLGGPTGGGRISVRPVADIECDHNLHLLFTVEIFDTVTGEIEAFEAADQLDPHARRHWNGRRGPSGGPSEVPMEVLTSGLVGITSQETLRLNAVGIPIRFDLGAPSDSCDGAAWIVDENGDLVGSKHGITIGPNEGAFVDFPGAEVGGPTGGGRISVRPVADIECDHNLDLLFSVEVFDNDTGGLHGLYDLVGPRPHDESSHGTHTSGGGASGGGAPPPSQAPMDVLTSGLVGITSQETLRLNAVAIPIRPNSGAPSDSCDGAVWFVDQNGNPVSSKHGITIGPEHGASADRDGAGLGGGPTTGGGRVPIRAVAELKCSKDLRPVFTVEVYNTASGRLEALMAAIGGTPD